MLNIIKKILKNFYCFNYIVFMLFLLNFFPVKFLLLFSIYYLYSLFYVFYIMYNIKILNWIYLKVKLKFFNFKYIYFQFLFLFIFYVIFNFDLISNCENEMIQKFLNNNSKNIKIYIYFTFILLCNIYFFQIFEKYSVEDNIIVEKEIKEITLDLPERVPLLNSSFTNLNMKKWKNLNTIKYEIDKTKPLQPLPKPIYMDFIETKHKTDFYDSIYKFSIEKYLENNHKKFDSSQVDFYQTIENLKKGSLQGNFLKPDLSNLELILKDDSIVRPVIHDTQYDSQKILEVTDLYKSKSLVENQKKVVSESGVLSSFKSQKVELVPNTLPSRTRRRDLHDNMHKVSTKKISLEDSDTILFDFL